MKLEVGSILEGKITGITNFGVFVELPGGDTGMVHISEIASSFVKEIRDYVKEGQMVKVKVLNVGEKGKIALSMKQAIKKDENQEKSNKFSSGKNRRFNNNFSLKDNEKKESSSFEDMMSRFKKASDEKMSDLKRATESKRGGFSRRSNSNQSR